MDIRERERGKGETFDLIMTENFLKLTSDSNKLTKHQKPSRPHPGPPHLKCKQRQRKKEAERNTFAYLQRSGNENDIQLFLRNHASKEGMP